MAKYSARPIRRNGPLRSVSVLIPVRNGGAFLREKLRSVLAQDYPADLIQIIVLSDGSTDDTNDVAREFAPQGVQLIQARGKGKPAALNLGIPHATGDILVLTDVRQTLDPLCIRKLVACFEEENVGVVSGELVIRSGRSQAEFDIGLYWRFETWVRKQLASIDSMFGATGPIYAMRRHLAVQLPGDILLDDMYLPLTAFFKGFRLIVEHEAIAFDHPAELASEFRRKVRTLAGNYQILKYLPQLLGPRNRMWFHFVSYKTGRLLLPFALGLLASASLSLDGLLGALIVSAQASFYALALIDFCLPNSPLKKISSPARTFVVMMVAAVCGLSILFVPARSLWTPSTIKPLDTSVVEKSLPS